MWGSSMNIVIRLRAGRPGFDSQMGWGFFLFIAEFRPALELTHPPIQLVPGAKRPGLEADHTHPPSTAAVLSICGAVSFLWTGY
jgi:hypothetical protein